MDLSSVQPLLDWLNSHQQWVAASLILIAFLESLALAGVVIPGVLLLFGASAVAGSGALGIWPTLACAFGGAVLGDCTSFFLGKHLKQHIKDIWPFRRYPEWITNGEAFFARHGGKSIIIGRFVGPIRPVIPLVAGMLDMNAGRFVSINILSAIGWAPTYVIPGFLFGASIHWGVQFPGGFSRLLLYTAVIAGIGFLMMKLTHWQLSPESYLYRALHRWVERQHHVRLFWYWLAERRGHRHTFPLPSFSLLILGVLCFTVLAYLVTATGLFTAINQEAFAYFQGLNHPWLDSSFAVITMLGDKYHVWMVSGVFVLWLFHKRHYSAALICVIALLLTEQLTHLLKHGLEIARPLLNDNNQPSLTAFPSGHATRATLLFGLLASFIAQEFHHGRRWWIYGTALIPMLLVAISRLYLKQHWLTDVIGGLLLGLVACAASRLVFSRYNTRAIVADHGFVVAVLAALVTSAVYMISHYPTLMGWIQNQAL